MRLEICWYHEHDDDKDKSYSSVHFMYIIFTFHFIVTFVEVRILKWSSRILTLILSFFLSEGETCEHEEICSHDHVALYD